MRKSLLVLITLLITAALLLAACNSDNGSNNEELPEARPLLEEAAGYIQDAESFGLELEVEGYPVEIGVGDLGLGSDLVLNVTYADAVFQAPDRLDADVDISLEQVGARIDLIAINFDHYLRSDIITAGRWLHAELIPGFSPASLQTEDGGIAQALNSVTELEMLGATDLDGINVYHLRGQVEAQKINSLTFGLIRTQEGLLDIEVYILRDGHHIERIVIHEPPPADAGADVEETTWNITFKDYNADVNITAPDM